MSALCQKRTLARLFDYFIDDLATQEVDRDETKHCASGGLGVGRYANGRIGADHERAIANGRRLYGCRRHPAAGRGAGVFLQKGNALVFCDVAETPASPTVATKYCKPVK